jgi:hypothetical protein
MTGFDGGFGSFNIDTDSVNHIGIEIRQPGMGETMKVTGFFSAECIKPDGTTRWKEDKCNMLTNLGFNLMLDSTFNSGAPNSATIYTAWYIGLITNTTPTLAVGDLMNSKAWTEDSIHYTLSTRPQWTSGPAASKAVTNASPVSFPMNTDNTVIAGIFVCSSNVLGGTSGMLFSEGLFGSAQTLYNADQLKITYSVLLS